MFEKFSRPYEERLVKELAVEEIFTAIHICGDTTRIVDSLAGYDCKRSSVPLLQFCQRSGGSGSYATRLSMV